MNRNERQQQKKRRRALARRRLATEAPEGFTLGVVAALYRCDTPEGIDTVFDVLADPDDVEEMQAMLDAGMEDYERRGLTRDDVVGQLEALGLRKEETGSLTPVQSWYVLMNVYWLEQRGHIQADDHNGLQFIFFPTTGARATPPGKSASTE
jgi:hypothetical protein